MSKFKMAAGLVVLLGLPTAFGFLLAAAGYSYSVQHVHYISAMLVDGKPAANVHDYYHGSDAVAAVAALCGLAWVILTTLFVLLGGTMISKRKQNW